ncbi:sensor domain-containing diguanylate cyclase [Dietzia kunjamensis]|uniref:GGDEF domain-containing protein n=1 Tax=Dietzia kunjamensis TaxID=322509 RepID=UPI002096CA83|nr:GGDEF domain-containing protein [Dietzia kunjamensis]USX45179.1 GGDEF domain-containing protein [Dietzia kunjamensis]
MIGLGRVWERFDARSAAILVGSGAGVLLPFLALGSPSFVRPGMMPALVVVWLLGVALCLFIARVGRLTDRQFAVVGVGAMIGIAFSAAVVTDPAASRAIVALLAIAPAIAAMASTIRTTVGFSLTAILLASAFSAVASTSVIGGLVAAGASILTVCIPVFMVVVLRSSLEFAMERVALVGEIDPLTRALNRRGLIRRHARVFGHCADHRRPVGFLLIDIDHFKAVNDTFGHTAGDAVLVNAVDAITASAPEGSLVSRIGGEEFVVMFPVDSIAEISAAASRIRGAVAADGEVTVSVGAVLSPIEADRTAGPPNASEIIDDLTRVADRCVYRAKSLGRDRVVMQTSAPIRWRPGLDDESAEYPRARQDSPTGLGLATIVDREMVRHRRRRGASRRAA